MQVTSVALQRKSIAGPLLWVSLAAVLAFVARLYRLSGLALRWDEGWSLAHASLPWPQVWQIAAADRHPPAYYLLLKLWLLTGRGAFSIRYLSVVCSTLAVPLAYRVARRWSDDRRVGILAAGAAALWPLLVYYGQVTRMYALSTPAVLAAAWFLLRSQERPSWRSDLGLVAASALALYTLYPTAWALAGLWAYAAVSQPRRIPRLAALGLAVVVAYLPWLMTAQATLQERVTAVAPGRSPIGDTVRMLGPTLDGLAFTYGARAAAGATLVLVLGAGALAGPWSRAEGRRLLLPLFVLVASALGVAYSARALWFAVRHLVPAAIFLCLLLAWALSRLARRWWPLLPAALLALGVVYWPTSTGYVYEKMLEVTDPFDPAEDHRYLAQHAGPNDLVYFNVLARAGWYESLRRPQDPAWSFAMRWDPVIEPMERIAERITRDSAAHQRLWFALYKGSFGPNGPLVAWLDGNLYPAGGEWQGDMLYLAYVVPGGPWLETTPGARFEQGISLKSARWTWPGRGGDSCALELTWEAAGPVDASYKVFVHVLDEAGRLVAQHDGIPGSGMQPTNTWPAGGRVLDRHGLLLPASGAAGPRHYQVRVGLYNPDTGERLRLAGGDSVELCALETP